MTALDALPAARGRAHTSSRRHLKVRRKGAVKVRSLALTPEEAAAKIGVVTEAWLRRKAGQRKIPCTRFDGVLGFSLEDCRQIVAMFHEPAKPQPGR
jgi:hypothetical protein